MNQTHFSRRHFLKQAAVCGAAAAAPSILPSSVFGAATKSSPSNRVTIGMIGVGGHGVAMNMRSFLANADAQIVAVCDVDSDNCKKAQKIVNQRYGNNDCATYGDFREVIARKDIDAICISTPDHWHVPISLMAIRAGKDVICEKPTLTIEEGQV
ncbi:MAG: Gfo/Idh/MocA family oxidoreductase, partial [Verrucomicrobiia bacterium]